MCESVLEKVKGIVSEQMNIALDNVKDDSFIVRDLGADSLDCVELLMTVEDEFDVEIRDDDAEKVKTIKSAVELIEKLRGQS
jgi:acyl carrier protein